jgi:hypothetical protein
VRSLLAAVLIGGAFGSAGATVESATEEMIVVDIEVDVIEPADNVVAHLVFQEEEPLTLPLLDRGGGTFGIRTELEPKNYAVVFEIVGGETSSPVLLSQLGADLGPESGPTTTVDEGLSDESQGLLWLAIALGAASLSALAFWVLGGRDDGSSESEPSDETIGSEEE